jgi:hypothetical protein
MGSGEPPPTGIPAPSEFSEPATVRQRNALGVAALVLGVASLVAVASFVLFPLGLIGGIIGVILGLIGMARARRGEASNRGQAVVGLICSVVALALAVVLTVRVGDWANDNRSALVRLERCLAQAQDGPDVSACFARFASDVAAVSD